MGMLYLSDIMSGGVGQSRIVDELHLYPYTHR